MTSLLQADSNRHALGILMSYAMQVVDDLRQEDLELAIRDYLPDAKEFLMTLAQQLRQEGWKQGRPDGQRELLQDLLLGKFGVLGSDARERLEAADEPTLRRYGLKLLTAATLDEVFED